LTAVADTHVRAARPAERAAILDLTLLAYQEYMPQIPAHWDAYRENIRAALADPGPATQIVAERGGALVGAVLLYPSGTSISAPGFPQRRRQWPEVRLLAVAPQARGLGIGGALMRECRRRAEAAGDDALTLHTTEMMRAARRLYERMGFVRVPELDFHPAPDLTVHGFRLDLKRGDTG
jgi:GNAT superfamily N-acetyltransferase